MANQIAANFAIAGGEAAARATAGHIRQFWNPRMIAAIGDASGLDPIAAAAFAQLRNDG